MSSIVTNNYRYKRPPRKKRTAPAIDELPTIITPEVKQKLRARAETSPAGNERGSAIVTIRK